MVKITQKIIDNPDGIFIRQFDKPIKIGGKKALIEYLEKYFGITTTEQYEEATNDCLEIVKIGKVYYHNSSC